MMFGSDCVRCPFGSYTVVPASLAFVAFALGITAATGCWFRILTVPTLGNDGEVVPTTLRFGLWLKEKFTPDDYTYKHQYTYQTDGGCVSWETEEREYFDAGWKFGRAVGVMFVLMGTFTMVLVTCVTVCVAFSRKALKQLAGLQLLCALLSTLLLTALASDICDPYDCRPGEGVYLAVVSSLLWIGSAIATLRMRKEGDFGETYDDDEERIHSKGGKFYSGRFSPKVLRIKRLDRNQDNALPTPPLVAPLSPTSGPPRFEVTMKANTDGSFTKTTTRTVTHGDGSTTIEKTEEVMKQVPGL